MSEPTPGYGDNPRVVVCQRCGCHIGLLTDVSGHVLLHAGGALLDHAGGYCQRCGMAWHWEASDQAMERLVRRAIESRRKIGAHNDV